MAKPPFAFLTEAEAESLDVGFQLNSTTDWLRCGSVDFTNVASNDRHWLFVRRTEYPNGCPTHL